MRILYAALKYDYGDPARGLGFEHYNFYDTLAHLGHEIIYFDFGSLIKELGYEEMNRRLLQIVTAGKPQLLFCVLFDKELDPKVVREISEKTDTVTLNWFCDDHWRFERFSRHWAPCFNWVVTTAKSAMPKYQRLGYKNVIKSQWGCNHFTYKRLELPFEYDVTFVGLPHGNRREVVQAIRDAGITVRVWGNGWESGRLPQQEMIRVFNQSRINLNLSNASVWQRKRRFMRWKNLSRPRDQIKGRNFEVPGCGGFMLTGSAENLEDYYVDGREIVTFRNQSELVEKIRYYLAHDDERAVIAQAGYARTLRDHTYEKRFQDIFSQIGLATCQPAAN